jgi:cyclophilin family peptidyl-prolyl cis-trans isomerase
MASAIISTDKGDINVDIFTDGAPKAANNFLDLAKKGFYDGVIFHRIVPGFVIQGGDPTGTGRGGPGWKFGDEINPKLRHDRPGVLSMANSGPNTNGSQFFICLANLSGSLPKKYTIFGVVTKGMDVVDAIAAGKTGAQDRPVEPVKIQKVTVAEG